MPRRDPETGQFVSGSGGQHGICFEELDLLHGQTAHRIDAADLGGGNTTYVFDEESVIADFGDFLDDYDVAEVVWLWFTQRLSAPTTSTAEGYAMATSQLSTEPGLNQDMGWLRQLDGADATDDSIDMQAESGHDNEVLLQSVMATTDSHRDTAAGTGGGSDIDRISEQIYYRSHFGGGPVFDEDDELNLNVGIEVDNISDHRVLVSTGITMGVKEWDVDECPVLERRNRS